MKKLIRSWLLFVAVAGVGCDSFTDPATRLAYAIEGGVSNLKHQPGAQYLIEHHSPRDGDECAGPYKVQLDKVGAIIIWCLDATGSVETSHSTSYHARFVSTQETILLEKPAGSMLTITLERQEGLAVITHVE